MGPRKEIRALVEANEGEERKVHKLGDDQFRDTLITSHRDLNLESDGRVYGTNLFSLGNAHPSRWMHSAAQ